VECVEFIRALPIAIYFDAKTGVQRFLGNRRKQKLENRPNDIASNGLSPGYLINLCLTTFLSA
jgi:hypothetical protein